MSCLANSLNLLRPRPRIWRAPGMLSDCLGTAEAITESSYMKTMRLEELDVLLETIPDVRDGLIRAEQTTLYVLDETRRQRAGRNVPTVMHHELIVEYVNISEAELHVYVDRLGVRGDGR